MTARRRVARWHLLRAQKDLEGLDDERVSDVVRARVDAAFASLRSAMDVVVDARAHVLESPAFAGGVVVEKKFRDEVWTKPAEAEQAAARSALRQALQLFRDVEASEKSCPTTRILARGRRRADAIVECGRSSAATSPTGVILRDAEGRPSWRRNSCNDRFCKACQKRVSQERSTYYDNVVRQVMSSRSLSDGRLRQVVLSRRSDSDTPLEEQIDILWSCFRRWQKQTGLCRHSIAVVEVTYNAEKDWWHPHLHVMTVECGKIDRDFALSAWQYVCGYDDGSGLGGCYVNRKDSTKEAMKYITKGLGMTDLPDARAVELLRCVDGLNTVRTYGAIRCAAAETPEPMMTDDDVADVLLTDPTTGEVFATTEKVAKASGARLCQWTQATAIVRAAQDLAWVLWPIPPDKERQTRKRDIAKKRSLWRRWKRSAAARKQRHAAADASCANLPSTVSDFQGSLAFPES